MTQRVEASASRAVAITDNTDFAICDAIYVGVGGDITITFAAGTAVELVGVPDGSLLPVSATKTVGGASLVALYYA